ncbi:hypothetical protein [Streptomyces sp. BK239]|uniref:hypothetical protein n=1 Tax=Streptomyces sp. BK239 TaxID=2512155 RepID=UPI00102CF980|nr:hypothetical protein [Streptomyces sp. BK239]RZU21729.1 hypothetical protein EV567_2234 [Streptomyces sp. BK239]
MRDWTDRFLDKIRDAEGGCWEWTGHVKPNGYGQVRINRRPLHAHRVAYEALRGTGPTARNARRTHCVRGHRFDAANTYVTPSGARNCRTCCAERKPTRRDRQGVTRAPACQRRPLAAA